VVVDSLKALDLIRPIREAELGREGTYQNAAALGIAGFAFFLTTSADFAFSASFAWCSG
jgi:hypothetical protein